MSTSTPRRGRGVHRLQHGEMHLRSDAELLAERKRMMLPRIGGGLDATSSSVSPETKRHGLGSHPLDACFHNVRETLKTPPWLKQVEEEEKKRVKGKGRGLTHQNSVTAPGSAGASPGAEVFPSMSKAGSWLDKRTFAEAPLTPRHTSFAVQNPLENRGTWSKRSSTGNAPPKSPAASEPLTEEPDARRRDEEPDAGRDEDAASTSGQPAEVGPDQVPAGA